MKFVMSYSCGKDSTLALHRLLAAGHEAVGLLVMQNGESRRSYFHGADEALLAAYGRALGLALVVCPAGGADYNRQFEAGLMRAKAMGAEACGFGDIDIAEHRKWGEERCRAAGLAAEFPLWQARREENVRELLSLGYKCLIKNVDCGILPRELLGRVLDRETVEIIRRAGADPCGENGEYHTLVVDGPIFRRAVAVQVGAVREEPEFNRAYVEISLR